MADDLDSSVYWGDVPSSSSRIEVPNEDFTKETQIQFPHEEEHPFNPIVPHEPEFEQDTHTGKDYEDDDNEPFEPKTVSTLPEFSHKPVDKTYSIAATGATAPRTPKARVSTLRSSRVRKSASVVQVEAVSSTDPLGPLGGVHGEDDDDDEPHQTLPAQTSVEETADAVRRMSIKSTQPPNETPDAPPPPPVEHFEITVGDPIKIGDLTSAHTVYTVHTKTSSPHFTKEEATVTRRYRDFRWVYHALANNNPGVIVPPPPEKQAVGRFDEDFVEARRSALSNMLTKISKHPILQNDPDFRIFIESDTFTTDIKSRQYAQQGDAESKGFMSSLGGAFSFSGKFVETEQYFLDKKTYVDTLESQFRYLGKALDLVVAQRKELSDSTQEFAQALSMLSEVELSKAFGDLVESFAQTEVKIRDLYYRQCMQDVLSLSTTLEEYIRLIGSIRGVFSQRQKAYFAVQNAEQELSKKRAYVEKVLKSGKTLQDKIAILNEDIATQEKRVVDARAAFDAMGKLIQTEFSRFEVEKAHDFRNSVELFLENAVEAQKEAIEIWETFYQLAGFVTS